MEQPKKKPTKIKSETEYVAEEREAKAFMEESDTEKIIIFPDGDDAPFECIINGVEYKYPKGIEVDVPKNVALLIEQTMQARKQLDKFARANALRNAGVL